jgi:hypothetical protein
MGSALQLVVRVVLTFPRSCPGSNLTGMVRAQRTLQPELSLVFIKKTTLVVASRFTVVKTIENRAIAARKDSLC